MKKNHKTRRRILALLLSVTLVITYMPTSFFVYAANENADSAVVQEDGTTDAGQDQNLTDDVTAEDGQSTNDANPSDAAVEDAAGDNQSQEPASDAEEGAIVGADGNAEYVVGKDDLEAAKVQGEAAASEKAAADALAGEGIENKDAKRLAKAIFAESKAEPNDTEYPRSLDGSTIEEISAAWVIGTDISDDPLLVVKPKNDNNQTVRLQINYSLSGENNYDAGDVTITIPSHIFKDRNGNDYGTLIIPYPEDPSMNGDFNWKLEDDNYVLTNTRTLKAATKGFIQFDITNLYPHALVDMMESEPFSAYIQVLTHLDHTIALRSNEITAKFDTEAKVTDVTKSVYGEPEVVGKEVIPMSQRVEGVEQYVKVVWYVTVLTKANTYYTMSYVDTLPGEETNEDGDKYKGFIIGGTTDKDGNSVLKKNVYTGYASDHLFTYTITTAYPVDEFNNFEEEKYYTFHNNIEFTITEVDPEVKDENGNVIDEKLVTTDSASAEVSWNYAAPEHLNPTGHYMVFKNGNDDTDNNNTTHKIINGKYTTTNDIHMWYRQYEGWYGSYSSALNEMQEEYADHGEDGFVRLSYTIDSIGYVMPWLFDKNSYAADGAQAPRNIANYTRSVELTTNDYGISIGRKGDKLKVGKDYKFISIEFPADPYLYRGTPNRINEDGSWYAKTYYDGTFLYNRDNDRKNWPDITLQILRNGEWEDYAVASWKSGSFIATLADGSTQTNRVIDVPEDIENFRTVVTMKNTATKNSTTQAAIDYDVRVVVGLKTTEAMIERIEEAFSKSNTPKMYIYNRANITGVYGDKREGDPDLIVSIGTENYDSSNNMNNKDGYNVLSGYNVNTMVYPTKKSKFVEDKDVDADTGLITVHYSAKVEERSFVNSKKTYEEAVEEGRIKVEKSGVWRDLLPKGMTPVLSTVKLRDNDSIKDIYTIPNYRGTGRTLLVVEADLEPEAVEYKPDGSDLSYWENVPSITFDATLDILTAIDYGYFNSQTQAHNVISFESGIKELGTVKDYSGEPNDPYSNNNIATKGAFANNAERDALKNVSDRTDPSFVYAGDYVSLNYPGKGISGLVKYVSVNNDGVWSTGLYDGDADRADKERVVYTGGTYSYMLRYTPENTDASDIVIYDSLENFRAGQGNKEIDINAPRWQGTFNGVDTSQLERLGIAPVVYYSAIENLQLADETDPHAGHAANMDLNAVTADGKKVWYTASAFSEAGYKLSDVKAIAIDASKDKNGNDFTLVAGNAIQAEITMRAPQGTKAEEYIKQDAHAYNNAYVKGLEIDHDTHIPSGKELFDHFDYTKVGLDDYFIKVAKLWDDDNNRDGKRPNAVTIILLGNGEEVARRIISAKIDLDGTQIWPAYTFTGIPYTDPDGNPIHYTITEEPVDGYVPSIGVVEDEDNSYTVTNRHVPEKVSVDGNKIWSGDEEQYRPEYIRVKLLANGEIIKTQTVKPNGAGYWSYSFGDLNKYENGKEIVYTVEEERSGQVLSYEVDYDGNDIINTYHPYGDLIIEKAVENVTPAAADKDFTFTITFRKTVTDDDGDEFVMPVLTPYAYDVLDKNDEVIEGKSGIVVSGGSITIKGGQKIHIKEIDQYVDYDITEESTDGFGATYSGENGRITPNETAEAAFVNKYSTSGRVDLKARKTLHNKELLRYKFHFEVYEVGKDGSERLIRTASNAGPDETTTDADGNIVSTAPVNFGAIRYTQADDGKEFTYHIKEQIKDGDGYIYDGTVYTAVVSVKDVTGNGTMTCSVKYYKNGKEIEEDQPIFENYYEAHGDLQLRVWKDLKGRKPEKDEFNFMMLDETGKPVTIDKETGRVSVVTGDEDKPATTYNDDTGAAVFPTVSFDQTDIGKTYYFAFKEIIPSEGDENYDPTVTYDTNVYGYKVTISDNGDGTLSMSQDKATPLDASGEQVQQDKDGNVVIDHWTTEEAPLPVFTNTLEPGGLSVTKLIDNPKEADPSQRFHFIVRLIGDGIEDGVMNYDLEQVGNNASGGNGDEVIDDGEASAAGEAEEHAEAAEDKEEKAEEAKDSKAGALLDKVADLAGGPLVLTAYGAEEERSMEGTAYAVVTNDGELILFRSNYAYTNNTEGTFADIKGNEYTGTIFTGIESRTSSGQVWYSKKANIKTARIAEGQAIKLKTAEQLFNSHSSLVSCDLRGLDLSQATSMKGMFGSCEALKSVDLSNVDASSVQDMSSTFGGCKALEQASFSGFTTRDVTTMEYMFGNCSSLLRLDLSSFRTPKLTNMYRMFDMQFTAHPGWSGGEAKLTEIDFTGFDTSKVTNMSQVFYCCNNLERLDLSSFNTSSVTTMGNLFGYCYKLKNLNISSFTTSSVTDMSGMFSHCHSLKYIDTSRFDTSNVTDMGSMFSFCESIESLDLNHFDTRKVGSTGEGGMSSMFQGCTSLEELDIGSFDCSKLTGTNNNSAGIFTDRYDMYTTPKLRKLTLGPKFKFTGFPVGGGINRTNYAPKNDEYTGYWVRIDTDKWHLQYLGSTNYKSEMAGTWIWETIPTQYTLSFAGPKEATGSMETVKVTASEDYTLPANKFYWFGHEFTHWTDGVTRASYEDQDIIPADTYNAGDKVTLTAHFDELETNVNIVDGQFDLYLYGGEKATFKELPAGTAYQVWEETPDGWVLVSQSNTSGTIEPTETANAVFTNRYQPGTVTAQFHGTKMLDNTAASAGAFQFELTEKGNENGTITIINDNGELETVSLPITVTTMDGGFVQFPIIQYSKEDAGKHTYIITEVDPKLDTIDYDTHKETVTVTVTENEDGTLSAEKTYDADGIKFVNKTRPGNLKINKIGENPTEQNADDEFTFRVTFRNENGQPIGDDNDIYWYIEGQSFLGKVKDFFKSLFGGGKEQADSDAAADKKAGSLLDKISDAFGGPLVLTAYGAEDDERSFDGTAYAVLTADGELIFFRSRESYETRTEGSFVDIKGNTYTGMVYGGTQYGGMEAWSGNFYNNRNRNWYNERESITSIRVADGQGIRPRSMQEWFSWTNVTDVDLNGFDTSLVTNMSQLFYYCRSLETIDLSMLDTGKVATMQEMFSNCSSLSELDVSKFNTENVTNMASMFYSCSGLSELDVSKLNTGKVTNMASMFSNCSGLSKLDVSKLNTENVTNMSNMFSNCSGLSELDVSKLNTGKVTNMASMFSNCSGLSELDVSKFNTENVTNMSNMFSNCSGLGELDVSKFNTGKVTNMASMFNNCSGLSELDVSKFNTENVTNMSYMFNGCKTLNTLDVSNFNTAKVTSMNRMFNNCNNLSEIDVSGFDTGMVTDMAAMFRNCSKVLSLDVSGFDTKNVTNFGMVRGSYDMDAASTGMFYGCSSITELDLSNFDTSKALYMGGLFGKCSSLTSLDLSSFRTELVSEMAGMFYECTNLEYLDIRNFSSASCTRQATMDRMFQNDKKLNTIELGPAFKFALYSSQNPNLPSPPRNDVYTGQWMRTDGMYRTTSYISNDSLGRYYNTNPEAMQGTWVWEVRSDRGVVQFDANGGYTSQEDIIATSSTQEITMPSIETTVYPGHKLIGWNTKPDGMGTPYVQGQTYTDVVKLGAYVVLYAQWEESDDGACIVKHYQQNLDLETYQYVGSTIVYGTPGEEISPEPEHYDGFRTPAVKTIVIEKDKISVVEYYYDRNGYNILFDGNTATSGNMNPLKMVCGIGASLPENRFAKTGSIFTGWNTEPDGSGVSYTNLQEVIDISEDGIDVTLYAIWMDNPNPTITPTNGEIIVTCKAGETIVIPDLPSGTTYTVEEIGIPSGWRQEGIIGADGNIVSNETGEVTVTNVYSANGHAVIEAEKILEGRDLTEDDAFTFMLYDKDPTGPKAIPPIDTKTTDSVDPVTGKAKVVFDAIDYTVADIGTHTYYIVEVRGDDPDIVYDTHIETVTVTVSDGERSIDEETGKRTGGGVLDVKVEYDKDGPLFTNTYEKRPGGLSITKNVTDGSPTDTKFSFKVEFYDAEGNELTDVFNGYRSKVKPGDPGTITPGDPIIIDPIIGPIRPKDTSKAEKSGSAKDEKPVTKPDRIRSGDTITLGAFETIEIVDLPAGATYKVTELGAKGWTLVNSVNTSGTIQSDDLREAVFTNSYYAEEEVTFSAGKEFKGGTLEDGMFEFGIFEVDENGAETLVSSSFNDADGNIDFTPLKYTFADDGETYHYVIREIPNDTAGITFDSNEYEVTVKVEDAGDGTLKVTTTGDYEHMEFVNTVSTAIELTKKLDGYVDGGEMSNVTLAFEVKGYNFTGDGDDMTEKEAYSNYIGVTFNKDDVDENGNYTKTVMLKDLPYCDRYEVTEVYSGNYTPGDLTIEYDEAEQIWRVVADNTHSGYTPGSGVVNKYKDGNITSREGLIGGGGEPAAGNEGN